MIKRNDLVAYANEALNITAFQDYCPNGLQVEGRREIAHIVSGVTASQEFLVAANAAKADLILVHHGYFWKGDDARIVGMLKQRLSILFENNINLLAYHLPLDVHPQWGNNVLLAEALDIAVQERHAALGVEDLLCTGTLCDALTPEAFATRVEAALGRAPLHVSGGAETVIKTVAWCTGAAQDLITQAARLGVDAFLTGEVSERTYHQAKELGVDFFACGHHATERFGARALGNHLAEHFGVQHTFIDVPNPI